MCFGNQTTQTQTSAPVANPAVSGAATQNINYVEGLQKAGFTPYGGQQIANFSPQQQSSFDMTAGIANNNTAPTATGLIDKYANAPASTVTANPIYQGMSPYMNQYIMQALAPQLQAMDIQHAAQRANINSTATGGGAFGDARTGIEQSTSDFLNNIEREGVIGNAYGNAFNTAIGASGQDVANQIAAQQGTGTFMEQALQRAMGGATGLENLQNQQLGVAGVQNTMGQQQTAQSQAQLSAMYNQWLMSQQYPFQVANLLNQTTAAGAAAMPPWNTTTITQPNNAGFGIGGAILGGLAGNSGFGSWLGSALFGASDERVKEDIEEVGALRDGLPVYTYRFFDDPENLRRIGLMAQDVEKRTPEAVRELWPDGLKVVDYNAATALSRALAV